ncbi:MAG TPA: DsbA family protein [Jatrophihabitantaceae bacterium]|nr:DsbA family protein [Jatrophihabitantaceae bacterium]
MSLVVFADFTCPECFLASRRAGVLAAAGVAVEWRAVEHRRELPVGGSPLGSDALAELERRVATLDGLLLPGEQLPWSAPSVVSRTEAAVTALAEAQCAGVGDEVRRLLFELYWQRRVDIGSLAQLRGPLFAPIRSGHSHADALRYSGYAVTVDRGPITTEAFDLIRRWRAQWAELDSPELPAVLVDGAALHGLDAVRRLGKEIAYVQAPLDPSDPSSDFAVRAHPGPEWTSWVGDPWRTANRSAPVR